MSGGSDDAGRLVAEARSALRQHATMRGAEARLLHPEVDGGRLDTLLADPRVVRFPVELRFDAGPLESGEFGVALLRAALPADGYTLFVDPRFATRPTDAAAIVLYHLVTVNYGDVASAEAAEAFGAAALGIDIDDYYEHLCRLADEVVGRQCRCE
ncbi:MAG: hypothetical protein IPM29_08180 [Planctomycetes bacterium]|nr:hypothetical protein [Planctomycetota bacterium]